MDDAAFKNRVDETLRMARKPPRQDGVGIIMVVAAVILAAVLVSNSHADCLHLYPKQTAIEAPGTTELCSSFYVSRYSESAKAVVLVAEVLDTRLPSVPRKDAFRQDTRVPKESRATVGDYLHTGYDMGHLAPADDAKSTEAMRDSFLLTNMTPQNYSLNRGAWRGLEDKVSKLCLCELRIVTGAIYSQSLTFIGKSKIPVPHSYYKVVWFPDGSTRAWVAQNQKGAAILDSSLPEVEALASIDLPE